MEHHTILGAGAALLLLLLYRLAKYVFYPQPLPGIAYDPESAQRWRGDQPAVEAVYARLHEWMSPLMARSLDLQSPVHQLFMNPFSRPLVVVDDPREVHDLLMRRSRDFDKSTAYGVWQTLIPRATLANPTNAQWKSQRAAWRDTMHPKFLRRVVGPHVYEAARDLTGLWEARIHASGDTFEVVDEKKHFMAAPALDVSKDFSLAALDAIWAAIFGERLDLVAGQTDAVRSGSSATQSRGAMVAQTVDFVNFLWDQWGSSLWPALSRWRIKRSRRFQDYVALKDRETGRLLSDAAARLQSVLQHEGMTAGDEDHGEQYDSCLMDLVLRRSLLAAQKAGQVLPDPATNDDLKDELLLMIFAGHDTTSHTLQWFVKYMTNNQEAQTKLRRALQSGLGNNSSDVGGGDGDLPNCASILSADIPYLNAVMEETLRCASTASRGIRVAKANTEILGRPIPKGTQVLLSLNVRWKPVPVPDDVRSPSSREAKNDWVHHPAAQELDRFRPERWLKTDERGGDVFDQDVLPRLSFSGGTRGCFGRRLAMMELRVMICVVTLKFKFLPIPDELNSPLAHERLLRAPLQCYVNLQPVTS
ncbi:cytochrome P450 oxidoreductase [Apiospora marii]|uniref:Cytochrome P450 oxidoreductase n=1 Tax=Apiospora marii TaxID=335849 RepID=A0ABR1SH11_9PEZI